MSLLGTEIVYVDGLAATGQPSAYQEQTTAAAVAAVADLGAFPYQTNTATTAATLSAANIVGAGSPVETYLNMTGTLGAGAALTLPTVAAMVAAIANPQVGGNYKLRVINSSAGNFAWTVTTNTGWTLGGTMTVAQNTWRDFVINLTSLTAATLQSVGTGTFS